MHLVATAAVLISFLLIRPCPACLRATLDDRAVQWSSEIVLAKLAAIGDPTPMDSAATNSNIQYQTYDFEITESYDGPGKVGDKVRVIRFVDGVDSQKSSICGQTFTSSQVGKSFLLLLRPEADLRWSDDGADPRTPEVHALKAFVVVHLESARDLGTDGLDDAKYTISSARAAEAQFKAEDARLQTQTMINAADDTEESQAEHALLEMGFKVAPILQEAMSQADPGSRGRLQKILRAVSPPTLSAAMHQH
jgi:hypothetical protein